MAATRSELQLYSNIYLLSQLTYREPVSCRDADSYKQLTPVEITKSILKCTEQYAAGIVEAFSSYPMLMRERLRPVCAVLNEH